MVRVSSLYDLIMEANLLGEFRQFLEDHGITSQLAAPGQPQQNDVAKRRNRTLLEMVRSMMITRVSQYPFGDMH